MGIVLSILIMEQCHIEQQLDVMLFLMTRHLRIRQRGESPFSRLLFYQQVIVLLQQVHTSLDT